MINVLVKLEVKSFEALEEFERQAVSVMSQYGGQLLTAFETAHDSRGAGVEYHVLHFPSEDAFSRYRADPRLVELASARSRAISNTEIEQSIRIKTYEN